MINPYDKQLPPEGDIYRREAISCGVSNDHILKTKTLTNTFQEAKAIKKLLNFKSNKIILVKSAFHMKRAKKVFERKGIFVQPYLVDFKSNRSYKSLCKNPLNFMPDARNLSQSYVKIREIIRRIINLSF